jgi:hypothetical protein
MKDVYIVAYELQEGPVVAPIPMPIANPNMSLPVSNPKDSSPHKRAKMEHNGSCPVDEYCPNPIMQAPLPNVDLSGDLFEMVV